MRLNLETYNEFKRMRKYHLVLAILNIALILMCCAAGVGYCFAGVVVSAVLWFAAMVAWGISAYFNITSCIEYHKMIKEADNG